MYPVCLGGISGEGVCSGCGVPGRAKCVGVGVVQCVYCTLKKG